jgi:asparagine synthase (glutamine-hydrolysing)
MCGIAGFVIEGEARRRSSDLKAMTSALVHRGPDGEGHVFASRCALGHRRLSIIDLAGGAQPMTGESGLALTFNGEIYNYRELRLELEAKGRRFKTDSDTEVLLAGLEMAGEAWIERLVGMFAFAAWDPARQSLLLARDRLGKKPLYYARRPGLFAFASEIKALLELPELRQTAEIDPLAISDFLSLGYVLSPKTAFTGIHRLPGGHLARFQAEGERLEIRPYWRLEEHVLAPREPYGAAARERFLELLDSAVELRLRADVPVGVYLSGGLDSSSVAALMARNHQETTRAFCVGFAEKSYTEDHHARRVAEHLGISLTILENGQPGGDILSRLMRATDEPFCDTSILPTYLLNQSARRHVTVALGGDGADEILAGYPTYRADALYRIFRHAPRAAAQGMAKLAQALLKPSYRKVGLDFKIRQFLRGHGLSPERAHYWWRVYFSEGEKQELMSGDLKAACRGYDPFETFAGHFKRVEKAGFLDQTLYVDIKTWLEDDILVKVDRMSMAHSLEVRSPFLDHRLVEFCARLAPEAKMRGGRQKAILKDVMEPFLPKDIVHRKKSGFNAPTAALARLVPPKESPAALFDARFRLDPAREDVTFKSFAFAALDNWLGLFSSYQEGGRWGDFAA